MTLPESGGVLPFDKPAGPTSHDVVGAARRALGTRRVGHTGTLDPFATGLLLLCVGPATRLSEYLTGLDKAYEATARLGIATATDDPEGEVVAEDEAWRDLTASEVDRALASFVGDSMQTPPPFSAKKLGGEAAHRKARRGEPVSLDPVPVRIHEAVVVDVSLPEVRFRVRCSSGTYIRALARDMGAALGTTAHLTALRRTRVGHFAVEDALGSGALDDPAAVAAAWIDPTRALGHLPSVVVTRAEAARLAHGQAFRPSEGEMPADGAVAAVQDGELVAVAEADDGVLRPRKVFRT